MSNIKKAVMSSFLTLLIILLSFDTIILMWSINILKTGFFRPITNTKILWSVWIRFKSTFSRKIVNGLLY